MFCFVLAESAPIQEGEATSSLDVNFANLQPQYSLLGNTLTPSAGDETEDAGEETDDENDAEENTTNPHT